MQICDMHSHVLPGIDDGARDWDMSMEMIRQSWEAGVRVILATPHYLPWRKTIIAERVPDLCTEAMQRAKENLGIDIRILPGQELYYHYELPEAIEEGRALTLNGTRNVLVEFSEQVAWSELRSAAEHLSRSGYQMILAHCERFGAIWEPGHLDELLAEGVLLQSNLEGIQGGLFDSTKKWLMKRYKNQEISFLGSDMHNLEKRPPMDQKSLNWLSKKLDDEYLEQVCYGNIMNLIDR